MTDNSTNSTWTEQLSMRISVGQFTDSTPVKLRYAKQLGMKVHRKFGRTLGTDRGCRAPPKRDRERHGAIAQRRRVPTINALAFDAFGLRVRPRRGLSAYGRGFMTSTISGGYVWSLDQIGRNTGRRPGLLNPEPGIILREFLIPPSPRSDSASSNSGSGFELRPLRFLFANAFPDDVTTLRL